MKKDIHPKYNPKIKVKCVCGANFEFGSTKPEINVEICSACHPFYTGKERTIKTGQVEKFKKRLEKRNSKLGIKLEKPAFAKASADKKNG
ncbi:MAG: 50S ribosomal protein L31 [bacterium]